MKLNDPIEYILWLFSNLNPEYYSNLDKKLYNKTGQIRIHFYPKRNAPFYVLIPSTNNIKPLETILKDGRIYNHMES